MSVEISPEVETLLSDEARREGVSVDILLLRLMNERGAVQHRGGAGAEPTKSPMQGVANIILDSMCDVPPEIMATMPPDGASQHDHYIYGWPKREA
jgi:hypothetical protein